MSIYVNHDSLSPIYRLIDPIKYQIQAEKCKNTTSLTVNFDSSKNL